MPNISKKDSSSLLSSWCNKLFKKLKLEAELLAEAFFSCYLWVLLLIGVLFILEYAVLLMGEYALFMGVFIIWEEGILL